MMKEVALHQAEEEVSQAIPNDQPLNATSAARSLSLRVMPSHAERLYSSGELWSVRTYSTPNIVHFLATVLVYGTNIMQCNTPGSACLMLGMACWL